MELITMALSEIIPYENNPRVNDDAVEAVAESIRQCGYVAPIIIDENSVILAGHTRLKALLSLGREQTEVIVRGGLTEEQKRKYRLLDNKTNELAEWDFDLLADELDGLDFEGFDFGFDLDEDEPEPVDDDYEPELPKDPKSKRGDIYQLGRHRVMCGDSTSFEDVEALCDGRQMDLLLTDPPYNVDYTGKTADALKIENDSMGDETFRQFLIDAFTTADSVMKPGASFYIWHADSEGFNFRGACHDIGWTVRQCLIWAKNSMVMGRQDYQWKHEPCLYGWKEGASHSWYSDRKQTTLLEFDRPTKSLMHPTMKPVPLFSYLIKNSSKTNDAVLDLFGGSGTTVICCEDMNRAAYVMELDPRYVDVIIDRWETHTGETAVLLSREEE